jgi:hypothetical protein
MPDDRIGKFLLFKELGNGLIFAFGHRFGTTIIVINFQATGLHQGIALHPIVIKIAIDIGTIDIITHQIAIIKDTIQVVVTFVFAERSIQICGDHTMSLGIESGNKPHIQLRYPDAVRILAAILKNSFDVVHSDFHAHHFFGMYLSHKEYGYFFFVLQDIIGDLERIYRKIVLLRIANDMELGNIRIESFILGEFGDDLVVGMIATRKHCKQRSSSD